MDQNFQYGMVARGIFTALLWLTVVLGFVAPNLLPWHVALLLFLALGLRPLLLKTGLHGVYHHWRAHLQQATSASRHADASRRVDRKRRDASLRASRLRDPGLPPRW